MSAFWFSAKKAVSIIDTLAANIVNKVMIFDKMQVALYVTWLWAYAGLYASKAFETFFASILAMPDGWLEMPSKLVSEVSTTNGKKIKILSAHTDMGEITNKLKLFLKFYWEQGGDDNSTPTNGFDFMKLRKLLNCSMLYCCYLLTDKTGTVKPEDFWNNVNKFLVDCEKLTEDVSNPDINCYMSKKEDLSDRRKLFLRNVDFDEYLANTPTGDDPTSVENMVRNLVASFEARSQ